MLADVPCQGVILGMPGFTTVYTFPQTVNCCERQVCKLRALPIFTFVNKMDRPSLSPFELLDQIEGEFGMRMAPVLWPIGDGDQFKVGGCNYLHAPVSVHAYSSPSFVTQNNTFTCEATTVTQQSVLSTSNAVPMDRLGLCCWGRGLVISRNAWPIHSV